MNQGYADIVLGLQYGDEGKARVVDMLCPKYDIIARFNGGANAGHTIETKDGGKVALNQVPSGIFYPDKILYIGSGCVVNFEKIALEIEKINNLGINLENRLKISPQASVIQPHHILIDSLTGKSVGTTRNGIGPCYADRAFRMIGERLTNIRVGDLLENSEEFFRKMLANLESAEKQYELDLANFDKSLINLKNSFEKVKKYIENDPLFLQKKVQAGAKVLFEGAQSTMLDVCKGSVPYVTSSSTIAAAAYSGGDLSPNFHRKTIGIVKAIMSRVGHGPFVSEFGGKESEEYCMSQEGEGPKYGKIVEAGYNLDDYLKSDNEFKMGIGLRILSGEYGTVTTRPRRVGALDLVQLNYAIKMNGVTELIINKCDLLKEYSSTANGKIRITKGYELDGQEIDYLPASTETYSRTKGITEFQESFTEDISGIRNYEETPGALKALLKYIEEFCNCKIVGIGVGPERNQFISL
ncbi:adenylosuccinate synthetase [Candidatus Peregrinibacteria bacterium]|nr:adenylosuccinate synthetase [Candidatus Peregrinibacteria bacterium]